MILRLLAAALVWGVLLVPGRSDAGPVRVMFQEGVTRGFPVVRSLAGQKLAQGDLVQVARGDVVDSRMTFRFTDGSLTRARVFSQRAPSGLLRYRIVQRGPSFPETLEASIDRETGRSRSPLPRRRDSPEQTFTGRSRSPPTHTTGCCHSCSRNFRPGRARPSTSWAFRRSPGCEDPTAPLGTIPSRRDEP